MNIFITGISSGIGRALAQKFADSGHKVFGTSRAKIDYEHKNISHMQHDLNTTGGRALDLINEIKHLDYVILNAGILGQIQTLKDTPIKDLEYLMQTNLWAQKKIIDNLLSNHTVDKIYAISSGAAIKGSKGWGGYALSKSAFKMLIELYAAETVNTQFLSIAPGLINTQMQDYICDEVCKTNFPNMQRLKDARENGSMLTPIELADKFVSVLDKWDKLDSGSFLDLRNY